VVTKLDRLTRTLPTHGTSSRSSPLEGAAAAWLVCAWPDRPTGLLLLLLFNVLVDVAEFEVDLIPAPLPEKEGQWLARPANSAAASPRSPRPGRY